MATKRPIAEPEAPGQQRGARPEGATGEQDAAARVREMFSRIAPRYDFLNHTLSLSIDRIWRARVARAFQPTLRRPENVALDVCCGTGDLTLALAKRSNGAVIGTDFAHPMLVRAGEKIQSTRQFKIALFEADALHLPVPDTSLDLITLAFGFRNLSNYDRGLREFARVLRPGGQLGILEFSEPRPGAFGKLYAWYLAKLLPRIGRAISGHNFAYSYLPSSVSRFLRPEELSEHMTQAGFQNVSFERWTGGAVTFHRGTKA